MISKYSLTMDENKPWFVNSTSMKTLLCLLGVWMAKALSHRKLSRGRKYILTTATQIATSYFAASTFFFSSKSRNGLVQLNSKL
jgi:hypothetical protein